MAKPNYSFEKRQKEIAKKKKKEEKRLNKIAKGADENQIPPAENESSSTDSGTDDSTDDSTDSNT